jgi:hypothetical protein
MRVRTREKKKGEVHWARSKLKRGTRAGGKQLLAVDGARGDSGGQRGDASVLGGASGVGPAASGRAGGQVVQEGRRGGSWRPRKNVSDGWSAVLQRNREGEAGGRRRGRVH